MEYCCHVWAGDPSCHLKLLVKLQKGICWTVGPALAASLEPLAHYQNVASLSFFYRCYFGKCLSEMAHQVQLSYSQGRSTSFFTPRARLWNSLPTECFPLSYNLHDFKSRINRHLLSVGSF